MTSLSQQLRNLALPQTSSLADQKKRASILFDPKEAATKDRKIIFDLGCQGLVELIALNHEFAQFEDTLFQHTSLHLERSVEDSAFNNELNRNIKKFLYHLSPYLMLRSSHMCLEWLIRRFQVHEYNKDAIISLVLPYHETNIFVKCVQILKLKDQSDPWNWLQPIQKPGVALPKSAVINRAANEPSFLSFICRNIVDAVKELGTRSSTLQGFINFYCSVVVGALDNCSELKEWHISTILPSILTGMKSGVVDLISASFMITAQLVGKAKITSKLLNALITHIWRVNNETLRGSAILLLSWITKTQMDISTCFPHKHFTNFISNKWITSTISALSREGISVHYIVIPLVKTASELIKQYATGTNTCKLFFEELLADVHLSTSSAKIIIRMVLETFSLRDCNETSKDGEVIDLESDSEMATEKSITSWYSKMLLLLERQYPAELDTVIKEAMLSDIGNTSSNALKIALAFRYKFLDADSSTIFQNIYHSNPRIRAISVEELVKRIIQGSDNDQNYSLLKETLADRIKDDNADVIEKILELPTKTFVQVLGHTSFIENVIEILDKAQSHPKTWGHLQAVALTHLTSEIIVENYDVNLILLSVIGYLFPAHNDEISAQHINLILQSPFAAKMPFLQDAVQKLKNKIANPSDFKKDFLNIISLTNNTLRADALVQSILDNGRYSFKTSVNVSHFLMMVTACLKTDNEPEKIQKILDFTIKECTRFNITQFNNNQWAFSTNAIPLQLFVDFLHSLVRSTSFDNLLDWESATKSLELFFQIFNLLTLNAFSMQLEKNDKQEWTKCLRDILNMLLPKPNQKLQLLAQFFLYENMCNIETFDGLRIRAIKLLEAILRSGSNNIFHIDLQFILKVIVALGSPISTIRECALNILRVINALPAAKEFRNLTEKIIERSEEIRFDAEQTPLILYTILSKKNKKDDCFLIPILKIIADPTEKVLFKSKLFEMLKHVKGVDILNAMIPVAINALNSVNSEEGISVLDNCVASVFKSVIIRFDENCIQEVLETNKQAWQLIELSLKMPKLYINQLNEKLIPVPCITLQIFDEVTYKQMPTAFKVKLLKLVIETISLSDNDALFLDINKSLRRCCIDCKHVLPLLECMNNVGNTMGNQHKKPIAARDISSDDNLVTTRQWKDGVILLEVLENKKRLQNSYALIPILFDILKKCLDMENQSPLEYTKQLVLSALLQSCQRSNGENLLQVIPENTFRIDLIVQCIRVTQNPQTHYNALLLLSHCALLFPQQVLHNLVDIFTFMGSSIARHDDAFSFQIISNIVQSIIPILVRENNPAKSLPANDLVVPVLKIFSDILLDVPEHRRIPLYSKLLHTLGPEQYFWLFVCVVFESHIINDDKDKLSGKKGAQSEPVASSSSAEKLPRRIEIVLQLLHEFSTAVSLQTCVSLMMYVKSLPMNKDEKTSVAKTSLSTTNGLQDFKLFDVKTRSAKQLRHYKYLILQFVSTFTSSAEFLRTISALDEHENKLLKSVYQDFIIKTLSYIPDVTLTLEKSMDTTQSKFWKVVLHHCYDALDNVISLLSPDMFLVVVHGLLQHKLVTVRKKVIELLITKLQQKNDYFSNCDEENILNLLRSLSEVISTISMKDRQQNIVPSVLTSFNTNEMISVQQSGLIAIKQLSKLFALKYIEEFKDIVVVLTSIIKKRTSLSKIVLATSVLTLVEVTSNLKANSISHLPKFMPHLVDALKDQAVILQKQPPDSVCLALITGIQKLFEAMPLFLGPYIIGIVTTLSTIWSRIQNIHIEHDQRKILNVNKLQLIWSKIAIEVPARVLIPNCEKAYFMLFEEQSYSSISIIMKLFLECISNSNKHDLAAVQTDLTDFFLKSLDFRSQMSQISNSTNSEEIGQIELEIINAFVAWILKLSESSFRPVYKKVYDWAILNKGPKERVLTYFIFNKCISKSLKSLFVLFASELIEDAAELLAACNTSKNESLFFADSETLNKDLIENILTTLTTIFMHDSKGFANPHRFDLLMQPIVDQLENNLVQNSNDLQSLLLSCIGQLAVAVSSDVLWKQLNYSILLKTRTNVPQIRIIAFNCCVELARKLGDDFTSLLPETIPFVAELFEDESPEVVKSSRKAMQELETILGESLQKYL